MSAVKVTSNSFGAVVIPSENNPKFGYVRLEQVFRPIVNGWAQKKVKSALIQGEVEILKELGYKKDMELPGRIQIIESLEAPTTVNPERFLKRVSQDGPTLKLNGDSIFRTTMYDETGTSIDILIQHNNTEEIKQYQAAQAQKLKDAVPSL